eukprot:CAMPEP_0184706378 /NCGR_PEP_ID=MMETSP0313-20130426/36728_1 /TAXON_ID=2792 /ORGANISM="Porphyridium aerugineum, Strain SAG 1380-2" /LENGTH=365 /DNA_ID=CAMNT_0027167931 /DNA_START=724 /DNA_END=1821 /DNA_ORIENTATION=-
MDSQFPRFDLVSEWDVATQQWFDTDLSVFEDELPLDLLDVELDSNPVHNQAAAASTSNASAQGLAASMNGDVGTALVGQDQDSHSHFQSYGYTNQDLDLPNDPVSHDITVPISMQELMELGMEIQKQVDGMEFLTEPGTPHLDQAEVQVQVQVQEQEQPQPQAQAQNAYLYESPETSWVTAGTRDKECRKQRKAATQGKTKKTKNAAASQASFPTYQPQHIGNVDHGMDDDDVLSKIASMQDDEDEVVQKNENDNENDNDDDSMWCDSKESDEAMIRNMSLEEQQRQLVILKQKLKTRAPSMKRSKNKSLLNSEALQAEIQRLVQESKHIYRSVHQLMNERQHLVSENQTLVSRYASLMQGSGPV